MAAQQILVLFVQVRVLVEQQKKPDPLRLFLLIIVPILHITDWLFVLYPLTLPAK